MYEDCWIVKLYYAEGDSGILFDGPGAKDQAHTAFGAIAAGMGNPHLNFNLLVGGKAIAVYDLGLVGKVELIDLNGRVVDSASKE